MPVRKLRLPSPALVVACLALLITLSGVGYAAKALPRNSVGTAQLKANAVNGSKVANDSLSGADIKESTLVPAQTLAARVTTNNPQAIATTFPTVVVFVTEKFDQGGFFTIAQPGQLTIPKAGLYQLAGRIVWSGGTAAGIRTTSLSVNGQVIDQHSGQGAATPEAQSVQQFVRLNQGDTVQLVVYQTSGTGGNISGCDSCTSLTAIWLGP